MTPRAAKPEPRRERRLVPDLSDTIEAGGQKLTRVARVSIEESDPESPAPDPEPKPTLDSIARKHLGASVEELIGTLAGEEPPPAPRPSDYASRLELLSDIEVPAPDPETNPKKRAEGAVSPIVLTDDAPDDLSRYSKPETLVDLFNMFPMIDGVSWYIHVKRKSPKIAYGMNILGPQRAVTRVLSYPEWEAIYGGGTFELIVYGPPKTGSVLNHQGVIAPRRLTDPFLFDFPGPPNTEGLVHYRGDEEMNPPILAEGMLPRRPQTIAEGKVEEKRIETAAEREIRAETREERERAKSDRLLQEKAQADSAILTKFMEMQERAAERESELRAQQLEREREHAKEMREFVEKTEERFKSLVPQEQKPDDVERLIKLNASMNKSGSADELRAEHSREIQRLTEQRTRDQDNFNQQLKDTRERSDRLVADERLRADQRIKDAEERYHNNERDARDRATAEIQKTKDECERRLQEQHRQAESRIADLDRNHARDLATKDAAHLMQLQTTVSTWEMRLDQAKGDAKRASTETERYKQEANENKDVVGKITKLKEDAAALGMIDSSEAGSSEPETFPQMLMKVGTNLAGALPSIVENIGNMMKGKDETALQQARLQGRQEMMAQAGSMQQQPPQLQAHQRRGVPRLAPFQPISQATSAPLIPGHEPGRHNPASQGIRPIPTSADLQPEEIMRQEALARQQQLEQQASLFVQAPAIPGPGVDPFHTGMPPEPQMQAPPAPPAPSIPPPALQSVPAPPPPPPPASDPAQAALRAEDQQIVIIEPYILPSYENQIPAELVATEFASRFPKDQVRAILADLGSADRLIEAFEREKGSAHPFSRRDGKKYLRALFAGLVKAVG
jgi:hypothetical protein